MKTFLTAVIAALLTQVGMSQTPPLSPTAKSMVHIQVTGAEAVADLLQQLPHGISIELHMRSGQKIAGTLAVAGDKTVRLTVTPSATSVKLPVSTDHLVSISEVAGITVTGLPPAH